MAVKTVKTHNVSLSEELDRFARLESAEKGFANFSEYVRHILRERRQAQIDADLAFLQGAMATAPEGEPPADFHERVSALRKRRK